MIMIIGCVDPRVDPSDIFSLGLSDAATGRVETVIAPAPLRSCDVSRSLADPATGLILARLCQAGDRRGLSKGKPGHRLTSRLPPLPFNSHRTLAPYAGVDVAVRVLRFGSGVLSGAAAPSICG